MYKNVYWSPFCYNTMETTKYLWKKRGMFKYIMVYPYCRILYSHQNDCERSMCIVIENWREGKNSDSYLPWSHLRKIYMNILFYIVYVISVFIQMLCNLIEMYRNLPGILITSGEKSELEKEILLFTHIFK